MPLPYLLYRLFLCRQHHAEYYSRGHTAYISLKKEKPACTQIGTRVTSRFAIWIPHGTELRRKLGGRHSSTDIALTRVCRLSFVKWPSLSGVLPIVRRCWPWGSRLSVHAGLGEWALGSSRLTGYRLSCTAVRLMTIFTLAGTEISFPPIMAFATVLEVGAAVAAIRKLWFRAWRFYDCWCRRRSTNFFSLSRVPHKRI